MKIVFVFVGVFALLFSSCHHSKQCFLYPKPVIYYIGFDSTDFTTIYIEKYKNCCDFDSLISKDTLHYAELNTNIKDTFWHDRLSHPTPPISPNNYEFPDYNYKIILQNNIEIHINDIQYEDNKCSTDPGTYTGCSCHFKSIGITLINCTYSMPSVGFFYIHK